MKIEVSVEGSFAKHLGGEGGQDIPLGSFPFLTYEVVLVPNAENSLPAPVLLPPLDPENAVMYDGTSEVVLRVKGVEGLQIRVPVGTTVTLRDGTQVGPGHPGSVRLSLNQVHHDDVPMPLPDGAAPPFAWTLQPALTRFDPPLSIVYPNMSTLPPGAVAYFLSFNHDTGRFEIVSSGHVIEDGSCIESDPGSGISVAGWGCNCPPYSATGECANLLWRFRSDETAGQYLPAWDDPDTDAHDSRFRFLVGPSLKGPRMVTVQCSLDSFRDFDPSTFVCEITPVTVGDIAVPVLPVRGALTPDGRFGFEPQATTANRPNPRRPPCSVRGPACPIPAVQYRVRLTRNDKQVGPDVLISQDRRDRMRQEYVDSILWEAKYSENSKRFSDGSDGLDNNTIPRSQICQGDIRIGGTENNYGGLFWDRGIVTMFRTIGNAVPDLSLRFNSGFRSPTHNMRSGGVINSDHQWGRAVDIGINATKPPRASWQKLYRAALAQPNAGQVILEKGSTALLPDRWDPPHVDETYSSDRPTPWQIKFVDVAPQGQSTQLDEVADYYIVLQGQPPDEFPLRGVKVHLQPDPNSQNTYTVPLREISISSTQFFTNVDHVHVEVDPAGPPSCGGGVGGGDTGFNTLDDRWTVSAVGQSLRLAPDGTFLIPNVAAADLFGQQGPGTPPDFLSDDFLSVVGTSTVDGKTLYAFSDPFQIRQGETFVVGDLTITDVPPPLPKALRISADRSVVLIGETSQLQVTGIQGDGSEEDVTPRSLWTTYRTSNPRLATVGKDGLVTGHRRGTVFITASNMGAAAVKAIEVIRATVQVTIVGKLMLPDGSPAAGAAVKTFLGGTATSNADGSFELTVEVPLGATFTVTAVVEIGGRRFTKSVQVVAPADGGIVQLGSLSFVETPRDLFPGRAYEVGNDPLAVAGADFDKDGYPDLAVLSPYSEAAAGAVVSVLLNRGDGSFSAQAQYTGSNARWESITAADLDRDGDSDLAVCGVGETSQSSVSVFLNRGDGSFAPHVEYPVIGASIGPRSIIAADLDRDGDLDLATANGAFRTVSVLLNRGNGSFGTDVRYGVGDNALAITAADLDGDGDTDLAVANADSEADPDSDTISVLLNRGDGSFAPHVQYGVGQFPASVTAVDLDRDGDTDLVVGNVGNLDDQIVGPGTISVLLNRGDATFAPQVEYEYGVEGQWPLSVTAADFDGDGDPDLVVTNIEGVSVLLNLGDGSLAPKVQYGIGGGSPSATAADLDGDAHPDLAAVYGLNNVAVLLNRGDGSLASHVEYVVVGGSLHYVDSVTAVDLDGDTNPDLAAATTEETGTNLGFVSVLVNERQGSFAAFGRYGVGQSPHSLTAGDLDRDGDADLVVLASDIGGNVSVLLNQGDGSFSPHLVYEAGFGPTSVTTADLDDDGDSDLAVVGSRTFADHRLSVLLNRGDGSLAPPVQYRVGSRPLSVTTADLDGDEDPDLAVGSGGSDNVSVFLNQGDGSMAPHINYGLGESPQFVTAGDLDADGDLDLATAGGGVSVLLNQGDGSFAPYVRYAVNGSAVSLAAADLDRDGDLDFATAGGGVSVLLNQGDGSLVTQGQYVVGGDPASSVAAADLDGDNDIDLTVANGWSRPTISVLLNQSNP